MLLQHTREETSVSFIPTSFKNPICKFKVQKLVIRSSLQVVDVNSSYYKKVPSYNVLVSQFGVNQLSVLKNNIFWFSVYSGACGQSPPAELHC